MSVSAGLDDEEVRRRTQIFGTNAIVARRPVSALDVLVHQFQSPVVYLLAAAAALAFYFGEIEEGGAIIIVLAINALIGFVTEIRAARSIEALRALGSHSVRVRRDGHTRLIPAERWCRATSCWWKAAIPSPPICGWWRHPISAPTNRR